MTQKTFSPREHDWHSGEYIDEWIRRDVTHDGDRRVVVRDALARLPFSPNAVLRVLDIGAGYGVMSETVLGVFPNAQITLQDYSVLMFDRARERLKAYGKQTRYVLADLLDPGWTHSAGGPFDLIISGLVLHNFRDARIIYDLYPAIFALLAPAGWFLNLDYFGQVGGPDAHVAVLPPAGFVEAASAWEEPPLAIVWAKRPLS